MTNAPQLRPLGETLGTEALGVDLAKPMDAATSAWVVHAFAEHPVLVFREQSLGAPELAAFGARFGKPRPHSLINYRYPGHPEVSYLRNVDDAGKDGRSRKGTGWRYGVPFYDRRRGEVKIPTKVE